MTDRTQQLPMGDLPPGPAIVSEARNGTGTAPREDEPTEETAVGAALVAEARTQAGAEARTEDRAEVGAVGLPDEPADPALSDATDELVARNVPPVVDEVPGSTPAPVGSMPTAMPGVQGPLADGASIDDVWANDRWPSGDDVDATWLELRPETPGTPETPETPETPGTPDEPNGGLDDQDDAAGADADLEDRSDPAGGWDVPGPTSPIQNTGPHAPPAPPPRRTGRWLLTTVLGAIGLALLFPLAIGALLDLVSLS